MTFGNRKSLKPFAVVSIAASLAMPFSAPTFAADNWRQKLGAFRIGIVGGSRTVLNTKRVQPVKEVLQNSLDMPVEIFAARDHASLIEAIVGSRIEYAVFSSTAFAAAWKLCKCVEPLAVPTASDGSRGFHSVLISRRKGPTSISGLKGKTTLVPGTHSFSGYLYPQAQWGTQNIKLNSKDWPIENLKSMNGAIAGFAKGKGDALLGWVPATADDKPSNGRGTLAALTATKGGKKAGYKIIWKSALLPHGPHAVRTSLAGEAKVIVWEALRDLADKHPQAYDAIEPLFGNGFQQAALDDYQPLIKLLATAPEIADATANLSD